MLTRNWVVIGKGACPWCDKTKALLHEYGIEFRYLDALENTGIMDFMVASGLLTVPQVYQSGHHVGGYKGTRDYLDWLQLPRNT